MCMHVTMRARQAQNLSPHSPPFQMTDDIVAGGAAGNGTCDMAVAGFAATPVGGVRTIGMLCVLGGGPGGGSGTHLASS